jgi:hypothetical protein
VLRPDKHNPNDRVLRCGADLTIRPSPGTVYHPVDASEQRPPTSVQLDSGALLIEFHPAEQRRDLQILTPQAVASVRGTEWAMEAKPGRTSALFLAGVVNVARANATASVVLRSGQGVDVTSEGGPLRAKRWPANRIKALLAQFGQ